MAALNATGSFSMGLMSLGRGKERMGKGATRLQESPRCTFLQFKGWVAGGKGLLYLGLPWESGQEPALILLGFPR